MIIPGRNTYKLKPSTDHTTYTYNDQIVPSVTTVLEVIGKKALMQWANSLGWKKISLQKELDRTALIGTYAHNYSEAILNNNKSSMDTVNESVMLMGSEDYAETMNAVQSFTLWYVKNKSKINVLSTELQMTCSRYGGTCDILCEYEGKLVILDIKTSSKFHPTQFLQLAAYAHMYEEVYNKHIENIGVLKLDKKNGTPAKLKFIDEFPSGSIKYYYSIFNTALDLYYGMNVLNIDFGE